LRVLRGEALPAFEPQRRALARRSWGTKAVEFWTAVRKMTLNDALYAGHRDAVIARLKADAADYIDTLEIK
jgi:hypothetical protein